MKFRENFGDYVEVHRGKEIYQGTLLPSPEQGYFLLKLSNGYNIGFNKKEVINIKILERKKSEHSPQYPKLQNKETKDNFKVPYDPKKKNIAMVVLGGTIAAKLNPGKGGVDFIENSQDLFKYYPELFEKVNVTIVEIPFMKGSENMDFKDWQKIAKIVCNLVNNKNISGVIVTQGTDTLHYTSSALSFFLQNLGKPVIITFSQRSIDRASSDANLNLLCSSKIAISNFSGVAVVGHENSNDESCIAIPGTKTRKLHSSKRDAFKSINAKPFFRIFKNKIERISECPLRNERKKCSVDSKFEEKIAILKFYPGQDPKILDYYLEKNYKGIIIEMLGLGQIATSEARLSWIKKIKEVQEKGLIICAAAQTIYGRLNPLVYITGRELINTGIIYLEDMLSETAYVKLGYVLAKTQNKKEVKKFMLTNMVGELNNRIEN
jgi:glutamyl-tRNA(Gln) amidotransferase subunit D